MGNWERLVWNQRDALISGLAVTIEICAIAFVAALFGGLALCLLRMHVRALRPLTIGVIEFCRATPIFVQLMWVNYVWLTDEDFKQQVAERKAQTQRSSSN